MTITIAYLYYNLLNLYGENGNIKMIKKILEKQGINVIIKGYNPIFCCLYG